MIVKGIIYIWIIGMLAILIGGAHIMYSINKSYTKMYNEFSEFIDYLYNIIQLY